MRAIQAALAIQAASSFDVLFLWQLSWLFEKSSKCYTWLRFRTVNFNSIKSTKLREYLKFDGLKNKFNWVRVFKRQLSANFGNLNEKFKRRIETKKWDEEMKRRIEANNQSENFVDSKQRFISNSVQFKLNSIECSV